MREIKCVICDTKTTNKKFCSRECYYEHKSINPFLYKGTFMPNHNRTRGKLNANWKGDEAGYGALHDWLVIRLGKPKICDECGTTKAKKFEWANISGEYKRDITDWKRLCKSCHMIFDNAGNKIWESRRKNGTDKWRFRNA